MPMARQWRIEYPGALYHVLSRGNGGQDIFLSDDDRHLFLGLLEVLTERFHIEIYAYVLMNNHYHLLLKTVDANLSMAMQWFGTSYTRRFNLNNHRSGHLFQGRYRSIIVENDAYLMRLSCYVHRNQLRAGVIDRIADYPWSSYRFYAYKKKPPGWLNTKIILEQVSGDDRPKAYRTKVQEYSNEKKRFIEDIKHGLVYGSQDFLSDLKTRFLNSKKDVELPQHNSLFQEFDPDVLFAKASGILGFDIEGVRNARRISAGEKENRDLLIYFFWNTGRMSNRQIGAAIGLTYSAVSRSVKTIRDRISSEKHLRNTYQKLKSQFKV
jgi:REP-associated tyrosine transposase